VVVVGRRGDIDEVGLVAHFGGRGMLYAVCCMFYAVCGVLYVVCCVLYVVCCMLYVK
jgi:hypothetical protein